jgi:hypothetical protein
LRFPRLISHSTRAPQLAKLLRARRTTRQNRQDTNALFGRASVIMPSNQ